ncbi:MAG: tRNA pseudouridine(38-40) synthase TruA [Planctomycetes bacterium]|nr:tRNA pseudouridine(38-40) synthase TruA [Planctomycetota bacterium]
MNNIKLVIEYDGTNYAGWQKQKNDVTVQETLKQAIESVVKEEIRLLGAGRTDSGVHALGQVANFETNSTIPVTRLAQAVNFHLPRDIAVRSARRVARGFHSQYSAKSKIYRYTILNHPVRSAVNRNFCYQYCVPLNIEKIHHASELIVGSHDFGSFKSKSRSEKRGKSAVRTVKMLDVLRRGRYVLFTIEADGFLYKMVRAIVGTLIEVGRGKISLEEFDRIVKAENRSCAGVSVPARGLCLMRVKY